MITHIKKNPVFPLIALLCLAALLLSGCTPGTGGAAGMLAAMADPTGFYGNVFGNGEVIDISIEMQSADWEKLCAGGDESYAPAVVTINGSTLYDVGIAADALSGVVQSSTSCLLLKTDAFTPDQSFKGLYSFNLLPGGGDPSYMRQILCYAASASVGAVTPYLAYSNITVNGKSAGLYLLAEAVGPTFIERYSFSADAVIYYAASGECTLLPDDDAGGFITSASPAASIGTGEIEALIYALNSDTEGFCERVEQVLDVGSVLKAAAVNYVTGNYDSYSGPAARNYYLIYSGGRFTYVGAGSALSFGISGGADMAEDEPSIESPVSGASLEDRPLLGRLLAVPEYYERYLGYIRILTDYFRNFDSLVRDLSTVIMPYAAAGTGAKFTKKDFFMNITPSSADSSEADAQSAFVSGTDDNQKTSPAGSLTDVLSGKPGARTVVPIVEFMRRHLEKIKSTIPAPSSGLH